MASCLQLTMATYLERKTWRSSSKRIYRSSKTSTSIRCSAAKIPMPPLNPEDPFSSKLASIASTYPDNELFVNSDSDTGPYLDIIHDTSPRVKASYGLEERGGYGDYDRYDDFYDDEEENPPPDLPSMLLDDKIIYLGMPVYTFAIGAAIGQACLLLAAGKKGKRFMMPNAQAMIQQPNIPSSGLLQASDVSIRAKEAIANRDTLVKLLAKHTGNSIEKVANTMKAPFYMNPSKAIEFGVIDQIYPPDQRKLKKSLAAIEKIKVRREKERLRVEQGRKGF
ncbi:hypothetical protein AQUCO_01700201v1 [Aquilegia coerulea]|uniref:ATP-dependent Clp protease proteolytic subunit n=1 Tax=Aquilegia coerulea TaxID=218851 RepID=A0A2G5DLP3_AQUCA|nr:hypothetical protein AQUCO_01700201v1 [Aquilegia coerulea]